MQAYDGLKPSYDRSKGPVLAMHMHSQACLKACMTGATHQACLKACAIHLAQVLYQHSWSAAMHLATQGMLCMLCMVAATHACLAS